MQAHLSEINELLNAPEGTQYEFKEAKNRFDFTEATKYCCALANCGGGKLVLGISDKRPRNVVGSNAFEQPERTCKGLVDKLHVRVSFQIHEYEGKRILVFEVAGRPSGLPVQADGIIWWREVDSLVPMPQEILREIYAETGHDFSSDICIGATLQDLDDDAINAFRSRWADKSGNERIKTLSTEQLLFDCGVITDKGVTYAALVLFGTKGGLRKHLAQAEVIFEYRSKNSAGPAQQREEFLTGFFNYYDRIWELVNLRNDKQHYYEGFVILDILTFNEKVVREAVLNAVSHRNYQMPGSIFVRQYSDRLVVESPGGFPSGITLDNILSRQSPRNRLIAQILALSGLVERAGQGMNLMYELSIREAKSLPDFTGSDAYYIFLTLNGLIIDNGILALLKKIGQEQLERFSTEDFLVMDALFHQRKLPNNLRSHIKRLVDVGVVEHIGRNKYILARSFYDVVGESGTHTRLVGLDRETNKELILRHIKMNGDVGASLSEVLQVLPSHSRSQVQKLLYELRDEDKIRTSGKANKARWFLT